MSKLVSMIPNAFPKFVEEQDAPEEVCSSPIKTLIYYVLCLILIIGLTVVYAASPSAIEIVADKPTYEEFQTFESRNPSCDCSKTGIKYASFASMSIVVDPLCAATLQLAAECNAALATNNDNQASCVFFIGFFELGVSTCTVATNLINTQTYFFGNATLTASLLVSRSLLTELITTDVQSRLQNVQVSVGATFEIIRGVSTVDRPMLWSRAETIDSPTIELPAVVPTNVASFSSVLLATMRSKYLECAVNWKWSTSSTPLFQNKCSKLQEFMAQKVDEMKLQAFWDARFTNTTMRSLLQAAFSKTQFSGILLRDGVNKAFVYDNATYPGFSSAVNYGPYYKGCAPKECRYVETRHRNAGEVAAIVFGLIGGVTAVVAFLVDTLAPQIFVMGGCQKDGETKDHLVSSANDAGQVQVVAADGAPRGTTE